MLHNPHLLLFFHFLDLEVSAEAVLRPYVSPSQRAGAADEDLLVDLTLKLQYSGDVQGAQEALALVLERCAGDLACAGHRNIPHLLSPLFPSHPHQAYSSLLDVKYDRFFSRPNTHIPLLSQGPPALPPR